MGKGALLSAAPNAVPVNTDAAPPFNKPSPKKCLLSYRWGGGEIFQNSFRAVEFLGLTWMNSVELQKMPATSDPDRNGKPLFYP